MSPKLTTLPLLFITLFAYAQPELPYKVGNKKTSKEVYVNQSENLVNTPENIQVQSMSSTGESNGVTEALGQLSVTPSGGAIYNIPIALPPGVNGVAPSLNLSYNSQGGNGLAGWGWNISGVSSISRIAATLFHDGRVGKVSFTTGDQGDRFALDGQRLMLKTGTYGASGSTYETEQYSNIKVTASGVSSYGAAYGPANFKVDYPDGSFAYFGNSSNSVSRTEWVITYWQDARGLRISYEYSFADNSLTISKIKYGGVGTGSYINEVQFIYGVRNRTEQAFIGGISFMRKNILKEIRVLGSGASGFRSYLLSHNNSGVGYDRLNSVQEKSGDGSQLHAPVNFLSATSANGILYTNSSYSSISNINRDNSEIVPLDYNGDGKIELIVYPKTGTYAKKKFWFLKDFQIQNPANYAMEYGPFTTRFETIFQTDLLNWNDKKLPGQGITMVVNSGASNVDFNVYGEAPPSSGAPIGSHYQKIWNAPIYYTQSTCGIWEQNRVPIEYISGDFNGDGLTDVLAITKAYNYISCTSIPGENCPILPEAVEEPTTSEIKSGEPVDSSNYKNETVSSEYSTGNLKKDTADVNKILPPPENCCECTTYSSGSSNVYFINLDRRISTGFANLSGYISSGYLSNQKIMTADVDGDGKTEMLLIKDNYISVYTLNSNNGLTLLWTINDSRIKVQNPILPGDYNGDGKTDFITPVQLIVNQINPTYSYAVFLSTGTSFIKSENVYPFYFELGQSGSTTKTHDLISLDIDGDSKTDILKYSTETYTNSSSGKQTIIPYYNTAPVNTDGRPAFTEGGGAYRMGQLNHLPIPVFLPASRRNLNLEFASLSNTWITFFQFQRDHRVETLVGTIKQDNLMEQIDYYPLEENFVVPSSNNLLYEKSWDQIYPYIDIPTGRALSVVTEIRRYVDLTLNNREFYAYKGAVSHLQGLGFTGFQGLAQSNRHLNGSDRIYSITLTNPQLRGAPVQQHSLLAYPDFTASLSNFISKTINSYTSEILPNKVFKLKNTSSNIINALEGTTTTRQVQYDNYNNPSEINTNISGSGTTTETLNYTNSIGSPYYIGRPSSKVTVQTTPGQSSFTTTEEWDYNSLGLITQRRYKGNNIPNFDKQDFTYDNLGNLLTTTTTPHGATGGRILIVEYDPTGRFITKKKDIEGLATTFTYNNVTGLPLTETNPFSQTTNYAYDSWGRIITVTDKYGKQAATTYTKDPTTYQYKIAVNAQNGAGAEKLYDPIGRLIKESFKNALGTWVHVNQEYDAMGRPWRKSEPYTTGNPAQWTTTVYDVYSRPTSITLPTGKITTMSYSGLSTTINDGTKTTITTKNALGQVSSQQDPGGTINYTYYSNGALKSADYSGSVQTIEQDGWGRKTKLIDPSAGQYTYEYNIWSEMTKEVSPKGSTEYFYDAFGKITQKKVTGDGTTGNPTTNMITDYTYDATTKLLTQTLLTTNGNNTINTINYDIWKRPQQTIEENPYAKFTKNFTYDDFGRLSTEQKLALNKSDNRNATQTLHHTYQNNELIRLRENNASGNILWELQTLNARGQLTQAALGNSGLIQNKFYDIYGLPTEQKILKSGTELFRHNYNWNAQLGRLSSRTTTLFTHNSQPWAESFLYDNMDRLTHWNDPLANHIQTYDTRGRIETNSVAGNYVYASSSTYKQKEINLNTAGQSMYAGHAVQKVIYNNFKQPVEIMELNRDKFTFLYNENEQRSHMWWGCSSLGGENFGRPSIERHYSADASMEITEYDLSGNTTFVMYVGGDAYSAPLIWRSSQGSITINEYLYLHRDYLGSIVAITDGNGAIKEKRHFDAWGNIAKLQDGNGTTLSSFTYLDRGYTGHEHLNKVGLIHMNGRLYDPTLHRFLMPDNYVQDPYNTQNFNRYGYVLNNPLSYTDPDGEIAWFVPLVIGAAVGMWQGGSLANGTMNPFKWDYSSGRTWGYMAGGAIVGAASGAAANLVATSGMVGANTASLMTGSFVNSVGTQIYTGGQTDLFISFGFGSFNMSTGQFRGLWNWGDLTTSEKIGYSLGALANLSDIGNVGDMLYNVEKKDVINHSAIKDGSGNTIVSYGPDNPNSPKYTHFDGKHNGMSSAQHYGKMFGGIRGTNDYPIHGRDIPLNGVNTTMIKGYGKMLSYLSNKGLAPYSFVYSSCSTHAGLAMWLSGVPNLFIHPYTLQASVWLWSQGITPAIIQNSYHLTR